MLPKTNFDGKDYAFLSVYAFKVGSDQTSHPYLQRSRGPSKLVLGNIKSKRALPFPPKLIMESIKSKKRITFSLEVDLGNHNPSKMILKNIKSKKSMTKSFKVGFEKHKKQDTHYLFPQR